MLSGELYITDMLQRATMYLVNVDDYDIVSSDARLAKIMQEQERLDAMMRREQKRIRRAQREQRDRQPPEQEEPIVSVAYCRRKKTNKRSSNLIARPCLSSFASFASVRSLFRPIVQSRKSALVVVA